MRRDEWVAAVRKSTPADAELMGALWDRVEEEVRASGPTQTPQQLAEKLRHIKPRPKVEPAAPVILTQTPRAVYLRSDGAVWDRNRGQWTERSDEWWRNHERYNVDPILTVGDVGGATVVDGVIRRGCLVCGSRDVVHRVLTLGNPRTKAWRGGMCIPCTQLREREELWNKAAVLTTRRLEAEGFLAKGAGDEHYLKQWSRFTWAARVMSSAHPESQEPGSEPFWYLGRGQLSVRHIEEVPA
jgi:hypothetical protein